MVTMIATVVRAWGSQVLVTDNANGQEVLVNTNNSTCNLAAGDQVRIVYDGIMTASLPPQIGAQSICVLRVYYNKPPRTQPVRGGLLIKNGSNSPCSYPEGAGGCPGRRGTWRRTGRSGGRSRFSSSHPANTR